MWFALIFIKWRTDVKTVRQLFNLSEVQYCPDLSIGCFVCRVIKTLKTSVLYAPGVGFLLIYGFVQTFLFFQRFLFLLRRLTYNRTKTQAATLRRPCWKLPCAEIWREFGVWTHEFANFLMFANTSLPTAVWRPLKIMNKTADSMLKSSRLILEEGAMSDKNIFAEGGRDGVLLLRDTPKNSRTSTGKA